MNSKYFLPAIGLVVSVFLVVILLNREDKKISPSVAENTTAVLASTLSNDNSAQMTTDSQQPIAHDEKKDFRYIQERLTAMQERRPEMEFDPAQVASAIDRDVAWETLKEIPKELPLTPEEFTDGREFISLDGLKIETLMPGDRVRIPIKELDGEYEITVDTVEKHDYNSISWNGRIEGGDGQTYHATFTRSASLTIGGMETPEGQYQLQVNGNKGWIASADLLFKNHADPIDPNTVISDSGPVQPHDHSTYSHSD